MYLSTINQEIENLQRRVDISLKSTEEIHVRIQDDVRMRISESTVWDGDYKKTNQNLYKSKLRSKNKKMDFARNLEKVVSWKTSEGLVVKFVDGRYTVSGDTVSEEGVYSCSITRTDNMIQFRPKNADNSYFNGLYKILAEGSFEENVPVTFSPYKAYADGLIPVEQRSIVLSPVMEKEE